MNQRFRLVTYLFLMPFLAMASPEIYCVYDDPGVIGSVIDEDGMGGGEEVTSAYVAHYRFLVDRYGKRLSPPLTEPLGLFKSEENNGTWLIGWKYAALYHQMLRMERPK